MNPQTRSYSTEYVVLIMKLLTKGMTAPAVVHALRSCFSEVRGGQEGVDWDIPCVDFVNSVRKTIGHLQHLLTGLDIGADVRIICLNHDASNLKGISTFAASATLEMPDDEPNKDVALSATMIAPGKDSADEAQCVAQWFERAVALVTKFITFLKMRDLDPAAFGVPLPEEISMRKMLGGGIQSDNASVALLAGSIMHETAIAKLEEFCGDEWELLSDAEIAAATRLMHLHCWAHLRCLFEKGGLEYTDALLKVKMGECVLDAFVGERLELNINSLIRAVQKFFNTGQNSYAKGQGDHFINHVKTHTPGVVILCAGRYVGERMDGVMSNAVAVYYNRRAYIDYLARKFVFGTGASPPNILEKSIYYRLTSKIIIANLRATAILWICVYDPFLFLCNANIEGFRLCMMAEVADVFYAGMQTAQSNKKKKEEADKIIKSLAKEVKSTGYRNLRRVKTTEELMGIVSTMASTRIQFFLKTNHDLHRWVWND
jgi:hypothetical protein